MNVISVSGVLGKDAEVRTLADGTPVASFSVADNQGKDKPPIWWNCSLFGKRAESLAPYLLKGGAVTVAGTVSERDWQDKEGQKRKSMDIRVNDVALQGGRKESSQEQAAPRQAAPARQASSGFEDMDDSIPFINPMRGAARCLAM
jgi:single-strand DNA-binding protein